MKHQFKRIISVAICLVMIFGILYTDVAAVTETTVTTYSVPSYLSSASAIMAGDINSDSKVNNKDLTRLFQYLSKWNVTVNEAVLDVNGDKKVNNKDLTRLFQYLSKWDVEIFPKPVACDHDGETELRGARETSCSQSGYTGDTYCLKCETVIAFGEIIPALPHTGGSADCCHKAVCEVCHSEYGEFDPNVHVGGTQIRDASSSDCTNGGYTGDTYCLGCGKKLVVGSDIAPTGHLHTEIRGAYNATCTKPGYTGDTYCTDCGEMLNEGTYIDPPGHTGGNATYYQKAVCDTCGKEYYSQILAYDCLNDNQKGMYNILDNAISRLEKSAVYVTDYADDVLTGESDLNVAFRALSYDKPEYFWMPRFYRVGKIVNKNTGKLIDMYIDFSNADDSERGQYHVTVDEKEQMQAELETKVNELVALTKTLETDFEKEVFIHDYLCKNIIYDTAAAESETPDFRAFTSYGALILGTCVCEGYSRAMQLICQRIGIPCNLVTGTYLRLDDYGNVYGTPHMWNIINPGDGCYYLDITFDDVGYDVFPLRHTCFNITKDEMELDHIFDDPFVLTSNYSDAEIEYNFFDTHGDNYSLGYYTKTGAYILFVDDANNYQEAASAAADYLAEAKQKGYEYVDLLFDYTFCEEYEPTEENPKAAAEEAIKLLNRQLRYLGMNTIVRYVFLDNYLYIPIP